MFQFTRRTFAVHGQVKQIWSGVCLRCRCTHFLPNCFYLPIFLRFNPRLKVSLGLFIEDLVIRSFKLIQKLFSFTFNFITTQRCMSHRDTSLSAKNITFGPERMFPQQKKQIHCCVCTVSFTIWQQSFLHLGMKKYEINTIMRCFYSKAWLYVTTRNKHSGLIFLIWFILNLYIQVKALFVPNCNAIHS